MATDAPAEVMVKVRATFEASGKTYDELGLAMGYKADTARKSAWQFVARTSDPRLSMLIKFATAMGLSLEELLAEGTKKPQGEPGMLNHTDPKAGLQRILTEINTVRDFYSKW